MRRSPFSVFNNYTDLVIAFSEKNDGSMRLPQANRREGFAEAAELTQRNRELALEALGIAPQKVVSAALTHSGTVARAGAADAGTVLSDTDGLVTDACDIFLCLTVADCLPIFLYDPETRACGLAHAGWRGLARGIITNTVQKMIKEFSAKPEDILAAVGPGISNDHFYVLTDSEALRELAAYIHGSSNKRGDKIFIDLKLIARQQLERAGLAPGNIEVSSECTACLPERYFSWRRDKPQPIETMMAVLGRRC